VGEKTLALSGTLPPPAGEKESEAANWLANSFQDRIGVAAGTNGQREAEKKRGSGPIL